MERIRFLNPRGDERFVATVETIMADAIRSPEELEGRLRASYPMAVVRRRELAGDNGSIWYVYRDGRWVAPREE